MDDQKLKSLRESVPESYRFPPERRAVTPQECAARWGVAREQVFNILEREQAPVMDVTASKAHARTHIRVPIEEYYRITAGRVALFVREREWTFFGEKSDV